MRTFVFRFSITLCVAFCALTAMEAHADGTQDKRLVLLEEFTNTGCSPCAKFAPYLDAALRERIADVVAVKYHFNFPSANDPYYLNEPADIQARASYYGVTGVPTVIYNGEEKTNNANAINTYIDEAMTAERVINLDVKASLTDHKLSVSTTVKPLTTVSSSDLRVFVAVVEEWKVFDKAFSNGEKEFYYVMQKLLPDGNGYALGSKLTTDKPIRFDTQWGVIHFYDESQLGLVVFVQDMDTKKVLETVYVPYPTGSDDAAKVLDVMDTPNYICTPNFTSNVAIRCTGKNGLRSAIINVGINGSVQQTLWSGNLGYLDCDTVATPDFTNFSFDADTTVNDVEVWLSDINGTAEQSPKWKVKMHNSAQAKNAVRLSVMTDRKPEETTWKLFNSAGDVVDEGGPYEEARKKYQHTFSLSRDDCYTLEFYDSGGDGINTAGGVGFYKLDQLTQDGNTKMLVQDTYDGSVHDAHFNLKEAVLTPIADISAAKNAAVTVYDVSGRKLASTNAANLSALVKARKLSGVFIIGVRENGKTTTKKVLF